MTTHLAFKDVAPAIVGGMLLSAGGSGKSRVEKDMLFGELACRNGPLRLAAIGDVEGNAPVMVASGVGAPGGGKKMVNPDHSITAARELVRVIGHAPRAVIPGHVPGMYAWLAASVLEVPLLDAACNGRGHPTVRMGSLGLSSRPDVRFHQCGSGDNVQITVHGDTLVTSHLMRAAAVQNGGLIMAARGYFEASLIRSAGAIGAIGYQVGLGRSVIEAGASAQARFDAALGFTKGRRLAVGRVTSNTVAYRDGFDVGEVTVRCDFTNEDIVLGVCNEFMTADAPGGRVATFPDLIASMDPASGEAMAISEMPVGKEVAVFSASKRSLPMGSGILDASIYPDVERSLGKELTRYALDANA